MDIYINYGTDPAGMAEELLEKSGAASMLRAGMRVTIKPNLVVGRPAGGGATTHPEIVEGVIRFLQRRGARQITIAEGSWVGEDTARAFAACGYAALAKKYGVGLVNTKKDKAVPMESRYFSGLKVCESALDTDFLINIPVLKGHCQTKLTCCLKNLKGLIPDSEKRRFHSAGLSKPIAALGAAIKPGLHIIDGICGDLDFEEGGNPVTANRVMLGYDPVLLDSYCAALIGYSPDDVGYLRLAREYGAGEYYDAGKHKIAVLNPDAKPRAQQARSAGAGRFAAMIDEDGACSACYAALVYALNQIGGIPKRSGMAYKAKTTAKGDDVSANAGVVCATGVNVGVVCATGANSGTPGDHSTGAAKGAPKIKVGQGFAGKTHADIGSGDCTSGCDAYVKGCPPSALDIINFLNG